MRKRLLLFFLVLLFAGCSEGTHSPKTSTLEKLIPVESYQNLQIDFDLELDTQTGKSVHGGTYIQGNGVVPFDLPRDQVEMALLKGIKRIKEANPTCQWICVVLHPDKRLFKNGFFKSGSAEYIEGVITLHPAAPTDEQIKHAQDVGLEITRLDKASFDTAVDFVVDCLDTQKAIDDYDEDHLVKLVAKKRGIPIKEGQKYWHCLFGLYDDYLWGGKTIKLDGAGRRVVQNI